MYELSEKSLARLEHVHPDLVKLVKTAIVVCEVEFGISEGLRDIDTQRKYVAEGKSKTMNSMHLAQKDGLSHAVDLFPLVNGKADYTKCDLIAKAMFQCAKELGIDIRWGGDFNQDGNKTISDAWDKPHFELGRRYRL